MILHGGYFKIQDVHYIEWIKSMCTQFYMNLHIISHICTNCHAFRESSTM